VNDGLELTATQRSDRFIDLTWASSITGATEYRVEVGTASNETSYSALTTQAEISFDMTDLTAETYYIRVRPRVGTAFGPASNEVVFTGVRLGANEGAPRISNSLCAGTPGAPRQFVAMSQGTVVQLGWQRGEGEVPAGYVLQVGSAPGLQNILTAPFASDVTSLGASAPYGTYALRMVAVNSCGTSVWGPEAVLNVSSQVTLPGAPRTLTQQVYGNTVALAWAPPTGGALVTRYFIEALTPFGNVAFDTQNPGTSFTNANTPPGQYIIRVRAGNDAGFGPVSAPVTVVVP
jgi:hypothetical protein